MILKQSATYTRVFDLVLASDHVSPKTGAAPTVNLSKNGAAFAAAAGAVSEISNGFYKVALTAADTGVAGDLAFRCVSTAGAATDERHFVDEVRASIFTDLVLDANGSVSLASNIKTNQALPGFTFVMASSTTHAPATGLTVTAQRSINGAGFSPCSNSVSAVSNGIYKIDLSASDLNGAVIALRFTASGGDDLNLTLITQP
jgi:hypothetical protein